MRSPLLPLAVLTALPALPLHAADSTQAVTSGTAFNPALSLLLRGNFYRDSARGALPTPAGLHQPPPETADQGFNLDATELVLAAPVDPNFDAQATLTLHDGEAEVEEAWFETRRLPRGLKVRAGRMKSNIGYLNSRHAHTWDFADAPLPYAALLGHEGLTDTGLRLEWLPDLPLYTLLGMEALQGRQALVGEAQAELDPASSLTPPAEKRGPRLFTAYVKVAPELGDDHALQLGLWGLQAQQQQEAHGDAASGNEYLLDGQEALYGLDAVYKFDRGGERGQGRLALQAELLHGRKDLAVAALAGTPAYFSGGPVRLHDAVTRRETAAYAQAVYGIAPRWQAGLRWEAAGLDSALQEAGTPTAFGRSRRLAAVLTWNLTEFSRLRGQYAHADVVDAEGRRQAYGQWYLTYSMSLGAHGAHAF